MLFCSFVNLFHGWPARKQMDSHTCFCIQSIALCSSVEGCEEYLGSRKICSWKRTEYFNNLFRSLWRYSLVILRQNSISGHFLKALHNVDLKSLSVDFHSLWHRKPLLCLSCNLNGSVTHCKTTHWPFGKNQFSEYVDLPNIHGAQTYGLILVQGTV